MKLLAIDGNSIINRAFYGIKLLTTKDGRYTNGIFGFLSILLRMLEDTAPDAVAVTFDTRAPTFRHKRYDGYKGQRKGMPPELAEQMQPLRELLEHLGFTCVSLEGFEADDLLGTLSNAACKAGHQCVIATGDRDSFQLINDCVNVRLAATKAGRPTADLYDTAAIFEKYGVTPEQLIDVKALMGDSSDNVPGVAGIGEKGALGLITQFGSLDYIYDNLETIDIKAGMREKLRVGQEMAMLSRELVTIDLQAPIDSAAESYLLKKPDSALAYPLMAGLELFSMIEKFGVSADFSAAESATPATEAVALEISFNSMPSLDGMKKVDVLFGFADDSVETMCIITDSIIYWIDEDVAAQAQTLLASPVKKRTNESKRLYHFALDHGFEIQNIDFDAEIAGYILNPTATDYAIDRLAGEHGVSPVKVDSLPGLDTALLSDCAVFARLADKLAGEIIDNQQQELLYDIELPLARVLAEMEHLGFEVDAAGLEAFGKELDTHITTHQQRVWEFAGEEFNINSPKQLGVILFDKLGLPAGKKTKTGYSTNVDVLESLADKHAIAAEILAYRSVAKLKSTYVDGLMKVIGADGRIHTSFQQTLTRTGRISSTEPNLQNIPIRTPLGSELRRFFVARSGCTLLDADYSQIELRVLAAMAGDKNMITAFEDGEDIHTNTAAQVFDMPPILVTPLMRTRAKAVNFGIVYGISAFSLAKDIDVSVSEADSYIKNYLSTYSGVDRYMREMVEFAQEHGFVRTMFQRRRYLPEIASSNRNLREFGKRVAMNMPIQGTAADIIKIAMVRVYNRLRKEKLAARLILQVHDELIVECPLAEVAQASVVLREEMENAAQLAAPLLAEVNAADNWFAAK